MAVMDFEFRFLYGGKFSFLPIDIGQFFIILSVAHNSGHLAGLSTGDIPVTHWVGDCIVHIPQKNGIQSELNRHQTKMANARILRLRPNATYIPLTRVGV